MGHTKLICGRKLLGLQIGTHRAYIQSQTGVRQLDNLKFLKEQGLCYADDARAIRAPDAGTSWDLSNIL